MHVRQLRQDGIFICSAVEMFVLAGALPHSMNEGELATGD